MDFKHDIEEDQSNNVGKKVRIDINHNLDVNFTKYVQVAREPVNKNMVGTITWYSNGHGLSYRVLVEMGHPDFDIETWFDPTELTVISFKEMFSRT